MESKFKLNWYMSLILMFLCSLTMGQEVKGKKAVGDVIYQEYKENGIDKALDKYSQLKSSNSKEYELTEWELNRIGYRLMEEGDMEGAERIFKLNMEEYPKAANPRDSYADYLIMMGDNEGAKKYFRESISIAEKSTREDEKPVMRGSKSKLAKLENKHKQFDFLIGKWDVVATSFNEGIGAGGFKGVDEIEQDEKSGVITIHHKNAQGEIEGKRLIVFDANEDVFDVAYIGMNAPMGIEHSTMKIKDLGNGKYQITENYDEDGVKKIARHELQKNDNGELNWVVLEGGNEGKDWKKVYAMDFKKIN